MPSRRDPAAIPVEIVTNLLTNHAMVAAITRLVNWLVHEAADPRRALSFFLPVFPADRTLDL